MTMLKPLRWGIECSAVFASSNKRKKYEKYEEQLRLAIWGDQETGEDALWEKYKVKYESDLQDRLGIQTCILRDSNGYHW